MKEKVAAYIRVSTAEQKLHGLSLDAQRQKLREYAKRNKLDIVSWYEDEGISGRKLIKKRPALQRMIQDAQRGIFTRIIFIKIDRFFRSVAEYHECMKLIDPVIWTATEEKYDLSTANGRAFVNMKLTIAELEADQTGERIKLVNQYKEKAGLPVWGSQNMPFFAENTGRKIEKRNAEACMAMIEYFEKSSSIRATMKHINEEYDLSLGYHVVEKALKNPLLYGAWRDNSQFWEGYITKQRFDDLQKRMQIKTRKSDARDYIFSGLIVCPKCGRRLVGITQQNKRKDTLYYYGGYACEKHRRDKNCDFSITVFEATIEKKVIEELQNIIGSGGKLNLEMGTEQKKKDASALKAELERLNYAWQKGRIKTAEEYDKRYDEIEAKIQAIEESNAAVPPAYQSMLYDNWQAIYADLDNAHKCAFWKQILSRIEIEWEKGKDGVKRISYIDLK